jgi:hypothetical protein
VIFLAYNTSVAYVGDPASCLTTGCVAFGGIHGALITGNNTKLADRPPRSVNTYTYASYQDLGNLVPGFLNVHLEATSHEILEWLVDPLAFDIERSQPFGLSLVGSSVPAWSSPSIGSAADIRVGRVFDLTTLPVPIREARNLLH